MKSSMKILNVRWWVGSLVLAMFGFSAWADGPAVGGAPAAAPAAPGAAAGQPGGVMAFLPFILTCLA